MPVLLQYLTNKPSNFAEQEKAFLVSPPLPRSVELL